MARLIRALIITALIALFSPITAKAFYLPDDVIELANTYATDDVPSELIQAVIWVESRGQADAVSADGLNVGLMQLHIWYFTGDLYDKDNNVKQGAAYLQSLYDSYGDMYKALMAYHGEGDVNKPPSSYAVYITELAKEIKIKRIGAAVKRINAALKNAWRLNL